MRKTLFITLIFALAVFGLFAARTRSYTQLLVNDTDGGLLPNVTNTSASHAPDYTVSCYVTTRPTEIISTTTHSANFIRIWRFGNGTTMPYATTFFVQFGMFSTDWTEGEIIHFDVTHIPSGDTGFWELTIPNNLTNAIGYRQPVNPIPEVVAPPWAPADETLTITSEPTGQPIWMDGAATGFSTPHDFVNPAVGSVFTINNAAYTWEPVNYTVVEGFVTATVNFVGTLVPDTYTYNLYVNGPDGYAVTGPVAGTTDYVASNADVTALVGAYTIGAAPENYHWEVNPINVVATDFVEQTGGKSTRAHRIFNHTITFELVPNPPITYTVNVAGPAGYSVNGVDFPAVFTDANDYTNDLIGTVLTPSAAPEGYHWEPAQITVEAADFATNVANYEFELVQDAPQAFTITIQAFDVTDPENPIPLNAHIYINNVDSGFTTPHTFTQGVDYVGGVYTMVLEGFSTWLPIDIEFPAELGQDYPTPYVFNGVRDQVTPVELSSFSATLTANLFVKLTWVSQSETNMIGYRVYRNTSTDFASAEMLDIPMVPATNTSSTKSYSVTDTNVLANNTYYYWLESIDYSEPQFFGPTSVFVESVTPAVTNHTKIVGSGPNPFKVGDTYSIRLDVKTGETGTVTIYNVIGQVVRTYSVTGGSNQMVKWDGKDSRGNACGSGIYFYKLSTPSANESRKIVVVK